MFNVILPKKRADFSDDLQEMFEKLASKYGGSGKDSYDHEAAIYIVCSHKKFGVIGGARLIPMGENSITSNLLKRLKFDYKHKIYELSRVFFHIPLDRNVDENAPMIDLIARDFYQGLYESLKTISIAQKIKLFISALTMEEHKNILNFGLWPFERQAKMASPYKDDIPYVLGMMPMNDKLYETFLMYKNSHEQRWLRAI